MNEQLPSEKKSVPKWAYAVTVLLGPAIVFVAVQLVMAALDALFDVLAKFDYWWVVVIVLGYLFVGTILAGLLSTLESSTDD